jgi:hypothetical protein
MPIAAPHPPRPRVQPPNAILPHAQPGIGGRINFCTLAARTRKLLEDNNCSWTKVCSKRDGNCSADTSSAAR